MEPLSQYWSPDVLLHAACKTQCRAPPAGKGVTVVSRVRGRRKKTFAHKLLNIAFIPSF